MTKGVSNRTENSLIRTISGPSRRLTIATSNTDMGNEEHPPRESGPRAEDTTTIVLGRRTHENVSHPKIHGCLLNGELRSIDERTLRSTTSTRGWLGSREKGPTGPSIHRTEGNATRGDNPTPRQKDTHRRLVANSNGTTSTRGCGSFSDVGIQRAKHIRDIERRVTKVGRSRAPRSAKEGTSLVGELNEKGAVLSGELSGENDSERRAHRRRT